MKTVIQELSREVEYLRALVKVYESSGDVAAHQATLAAINALLRLIDVIERPPQDSPEQFPFAA